MPAAAAGPSAGAASTSTPLSMPRALAWAASRKLTPMMGRSTVPVLMSDATDSASVSMGIAKPTPDDAPLGE